MKKYVLAALLLSLYSCSTLKVQVSTADPDQLKKIADKIDRFEQLAFQYRNALQPLLSAKILTEGKEITNRVEENLNKKLAAGILDRTTAGKLVTNFKKTYYELYTDIQSDYIKSNILMINKKYPEAIDVYTGLPDKFKKLSSIIVSENALTIEQAEPALTDIHAMLSSVNVAFHGGRANLLGDKMVSYITLTENDWIWKSTYNKTVSRTGFGNADIAVVLNEMPDSYNNNYSIKGVRVDAAKLIQSTFDVMTQVINVAASMYGIMPVNKGDSSSFYPEEFADIKNLPVKTAELENRKELLRESQRQLLLKILGENMQQKDTVALKTSAASIKEFWDAYKTNLVP